MGERRIRIQCLHLLLGLLGEGWQKWSGSPSLLYPRRLTLSLAQPRQLKLDVSCSTQTTEMCLTEPGQEHKPQLSLRNAETRAETSENNRPWRPTPSGQEVEGLIADELGLPILSQTHGHQLAIRQPRKSSLSSKAGRIISTIL
ncbi:hypothetical protein AOLI_G00292880 [Acnodon oligacanthus]